MATYQFQGHNIVAPFLITSNEPAFSSDSVSLKVRRVKQGAQRWELEFGIVLEDASSFFADSVSNFHSIISMEMPQMNVRGQTISQGTSNAAVTVTSTLNAGVTSIGLTGVNGTIKKGRFIKFSNHDKIYVTTADYSGGSIDVYPSLRSSVPSGTGFYYRDGVDSITFKGYREVSNVSGITYVDGVLSDAGTINLIEAL